MRDSSVRNDYMAGAAVFLIVFLSTFPVVLPFFVCPERRVGAPRLPGGRVVHAVCAPGWSLGPARVHRAIGLRWRTGGWRMVDARAHRMTSSRANHRSSVSPL